jgi:hypothetical protein
VELEGAVVEQGSGSPRKMVLIEAWDSFRTQKVNFSERVAILEVKTRGILVRAEWKETLPWKIKLILVANGRSGVNTGV